MENTDLTIFKIQLKPKHLEVLCSVVLTVLYLQLAESITFKDVM